MEIKMKRLIIVLVVMFASGCAKPQNLDNWREIMATPSPRYAPMPMVIINTPQPVYRGEYPAFNNLYQNTQNNSNRSTYITPCLSGNCY